jgi:DNA-binding transcriptional regulator YdaS (Cro superfamily)
MPNLPPRHAKNVRTHAIRRASEILGGQRKLRKYLGVSALSLSVWIAGSEPPPTDIFLKVVDVIIDQEIDNLRKKKP